MIHATVPQHGLRDSAEGVSVGSLDSNEKGSGARKSLGKPALDLIPVSLWRARFAARKYDAQLDELMEAFVCWQEGDDMALRVYLAHCDQSWMEQGVSVLEFGVAKYDAWNWACGMQWSVCTGCALRHLDAITLGEETDPDSGLPHIGHVISNLVFLDYFVRHYPEGDDRPPNYKETDT